MPFLRVVQGGRPGELHELVSERILLGRHPSCEVILDNAAISRQHARLIRKGDRYLLEDLGSRNGTLLNGKAISGMQPISVHDYIRICDIVLEYLDEAPNLDRTYAEGLSYSGSSLLDPAGLATVDQDDGSGGIDSSSSIISSLNTGSIDHRLDVRPEAKLRAILELSKLFSRSIDVATVMDKSLECLCRLFPQAEMGLVLLTDPNSREPVVRAARSPGGVEPLDQPMSSTIIRQALESNAAILSEDLDDDTRFRESESVSMMQIRSVMCSPLTGGEGAAFGAVQLTSKDLNKPFNHDDLDLFVSVVAQAGLAIENAHLHAEAIARREMERDLEVATQIQLGFLPSKKPTFQGYEFWHYYQSAQQVGGDYFDYVPLPDGRLAITVGDVSGKGVPAALLMARLCSAMRYHLVAQKTIAEALTELNRELIASSLGFRFITLVLLILEPGSRTVEFVNAGHLPPLVHTAEESFYLLGEKGGLPLAVGRNYEYRQESFEMEPGACLLLYTDGITETENHDGVLYGRERLLKARPDREFSAEDLIQAVLDDVITFSQGDPQRDDRCAVAVKHCN